MASEIFIPRITEAQKNDMENENKKLDTAKTENLKCSFCDKQLSDEDMTRCENKSYAILCETCNNGTATCVQCDDRYHRDDLSECVRCSEMVCNRDRYSCEQCDRVYCGEYCYNEHNDSVHNGESNDGFLSREWTMDKSLTKDAKEGDIVKSTRPFGIELEAYYPNSDATNNVYGDIHPAIGITEDGSLNSRGIEYQTPPASGDKAESMIIELCDALEKNEYKVDTSCGYHIHINDVDIMMRSYVTLKKLWLFYYAFDDVLLAMLPASRRNNRYCKALRKSYGYDKILRADSREALEALWYDEAAYTGDELADKLRDHKSGKYDDTRYNGLNFHSLFKDGHLEVRYHSGTINTKKILEWANVHCRIHDKIKNIDIGDIQRALNSVLLTEKIKMFFDLLELSTSSRKYIMDRIKLFSPLSAANEENIIKNIQ